MVAFNSTSMRDHDRWWQEDRALCRRRRPLPGRTTGWRPARKRDHDDFRARLCVGKPTSDLGPGHGRPSQRRGTCHRLRCL